MYSLVVKSMKIKILYLCLDEDQPRKIVRFKHSYIFISSLLD